MTNIHNQHFSGKKPRSLPRVWKRFYRLQSGETFFLGSKIFVQDGPFWARGDQRCVVVLPWTRVRTTTLVRDARPGGKSSYPVDPVVAGYPTIPFKGDHDIKPVPLTLGAQLSGPSA